MKKLSSAASDQNDQIIVSLDTVQENFDFQAEINEILSQTVQGVGMGDDELLAELAILGRVSLIAEEPSSAGAPATSMSSLVRKPPLAPSRRQASAEGVRPRPPRRTRSESAPSSAEMFDSDR